MELLSASSSICSSLDTLSELIREPTRSVQKDVNFSGRMRILITSLFSFLSSHALCVDFCKREMILLDELVTDDLALEQIWQQADMQLKYFLADSRERLEQFEKRRVLYVTSFESPHKIRKRDDASSYHVPSDTNIESYKKGVVKKKLEALQASKIERNSSIKSLKSPEPWKDTVVEPTVNPGSSLFQNAQVRVIKQIKVLETEAIAKKKWTNLGESSGPERPKNSVLETELEFDQKIQQNPNLSIQASTLLEEIIKDRVLSGSWDDVELCKSLKRASSVAQAVVLQEEKNKNGLGEVYAEEYIKRSQQTVNEIKHNPSLLVSQAQRILESLMVKLELLTSSGSAQGCEIENFAVSTQDAKRMGISMSPEELYESMGMRLGKSSIVASRHEDSWTKQQEMQRRSKRKTKEETILTAGSTEHTHKQEMLNKKKERKNGSKHNSDIRTGFNKSSKIFGLLQERVDQKKSLETITSAPKMMIKL